MSRGDGIAAGTSAGDLRAHVLPALSRPAHRQERVVSEAGASDRRSAGERGHRERALVPGALGLDDDIDRTIGLCLRAEAVATAHGDTRTATDARVTIGTLELRRDPALGRQILEEAAAAYAEAGPEGTGGASTEQPRRLRSTRPRPRPREQFLPRRSSTASTTRSISGASTSSRFCAFAARPGSLDRGRETPRWWLLEDRASLRGHSTRRSWCCSRSRTTRRPGALEALDATANVGLSRKRRLALVDLAAARAELAWLARDRTRSTGRRAPARDGAVARGSTEDAARLSYWRRLAGLEVVRGTAQAIPCARSGR